jgi:hypothetical protein
MDHKVEELISKIKNEPMELEALRRYAVAGVELLCKTKNLDNCELWLQFGDEYHYVLDGSKEYCIGYADSQKNDDYVVVYRDVVIWPSSMFGKFRDVF